MRPFCLASPLLLLLICLDYAAAVSPTAGLWAVRMKSLGSRTQRAERLARAEQVMKRTDMEIVQPLHNLVHAEYYLVKPREETMAKGSSAVRRSEEQVRQALLANEEIEWVELQVPLNRQKRQFYFSDPSYSIQWHLQNVGQTGSPAGNDINVIPVWEQGVNGTGVTVAMVDDGLDYTHQDLAGNYVQEASYDFNFADDDPFPEADYDNHGTRCAGEIVATPNNRVCAVGVAFGAKISGIRLISELPTDADEGKALTFRNDINLIYSNSWGPWDNGKTLEGPGTLAMEGFRTGVTEGRGGRGSVYVFASGNGNHLGDDCNFDGYANSIYTIPIGAITDNNNPAQYSEGCSALYAVTYSSGGVANIASTDIHAGCTNRHSGTSAAAPIAAGMIALALSVRPELTWRDVQHLVIHSAKMVKSDDPGWVRNGAGYMVHHRLGFGNLDATLLVENARTWQLVQPQFSFTSGVIRENQKIHNSNPLIVTYDLASNSTEVPKVLEYVVVTVKLSHEVRGQLVITLVSPNGTVSVLAPARGNDRSNEGYTDWSFTTVRCWGENPIGRWVLFFDDIGSSSGGLLKHWEITFYGTGAKKQQTPPVDLYWVVVLGASLGLSVLGIFIAGLAIYLWKRLASSRQTNYRVVRSSSQDSFDLEGVDMAVQENVYEQGVYIDPYEDDGDDRERLNVDSD